MTQEPDTALELTVVGVPPRRDFARSRRFTPPQFGGSFSFDR
jgi:hypothetical protein